MGDQHVSEIPLPSGWTKRVKTAVLQVISLARYAIVTAQGRAANALNPRVRQDAEIALLQEDPRGLQVPAGRDTEAGSMTAGPELQLPHCSPSALTRRSRSALLPGAVLAGVAVGSVAKQDPFPNPQRPPLLPCRSRTEVDGPPQQPAGRKTVGQAGLPNLGATTLDNLGDLRAARRAGGEGVRSAPARPTDWLHRTSLSHMQSKWSFFTTGVWGRSTQRNASGSNRGI